jgi:hypothetical protein
LSSPFGRPAASEIRQVLVQVQVMDPYKHFGPFLHAPVQTMDLYEHYSSRKPKTCVPPSRARCGLFSANLVHDIGNRRRSCAVSAFKWRRGYVRKRRGGHFPPVFPTGFVKINNAIHTFTEATTIDGIVFLISSSLDLSSR